MADTKISGMTAASALTGAEVLPVVQSAANVKATTQQVVDAAMTTGLTRQALGSINTNTTIDWSVGSYVTATIGGALTFTFSNPAPTGNACVAYLQLTNGGSAVITWPVSVTWSGGTAPTLRASGVDLLRFYTQDNGTTWFGTAENDEQQFAASAITSGTFDAARLGSGTANSTTFLRGDQTWGSPSVTGFTAAESTAAPNATVYVDSLAANGSVTNVDAAFVPKGTGAVLASIPDSATAGGNKRGANAVDWQTYRTVNSRVASGQYSTIVGGDNNTASGTSSIAGGSACTASGLSAVSFGSSNTASATGSVTIGSGLAANASNATAFGTTNTASGVAAFVVGSTNTASGAYSWVPGGLQATTRSLRGAYAYSSGRRSATGDSQIIGQPVRSTTTATSATDLTADGGAASATNIMVLPNNSGAGFRAHVMAYRSGGGVGSWLVQGTIERGANAASTALVGATTITAFGISASIGAPTVDVVADTTQGGAKVQVTPANTDTTYWVAELILIQGA